MLAAVAVLFAPVPARAVGESPPIAYNLHCIGCHFEDGMGARSGGVPPIPGMSGHLLKHAKGRLYLAHVPGIVNAHLPHAETAALINYVLERWAAKELPAQWERFTGEELERLRAEKVDDITALRKEIAADLLKQGIDISF
jgi:hypothetical protein